MRNHSEGVLNMQQNLGAADRYMRLVTGLIAIGCASTHRRQSPLAKTFLLSFGAMKIAEGVIGWCPMQYATQMASEKSPGTSITKQQHNQKTSHSNSKKEKLSSSQSSHADSSQSSNAEKSEEEHVTH